MTLLSKSRSRFFALGRRCGLLSVTLAMTLTVATAAFGQAPSGVATQAPPDSQGDALPQPGSQNALTTSRRSADGPPAAFTAGERQRLAVNPVTGLVTSSASNYEPLTGKERWKLYWKQNYFSIGAYFGPVFTALLLDQTTDSPSQWGPGASGFGLRVASRTANAMIQGTLQAPVAAILHEDVRYISSAQHGFKHRAVHGIEYSLLTYNDRGHPTLNVANLGGYYASTAISTTWLPGRRNVGTYTLSNGGEQIALSVPVNLLQEFWPEITHKVFHGL